MIPIYEIPDNANNHNIYEMARIGRVDDWVICVFGGEGPIPHFHMRSPSVENPERECCVKFESPEYFSHGSKVDKLSKQIKKDLVKFLISNHKRYDVTNWKYLIDLWNQENEENKATKQLDRDIPMPDYTKL